MREVSQFEGVIPDRVAALHAVLALEDRQAVLRRAKEVALTLRSRKNRFQNADDRAPNAGNEDPGGAVQDQVGEDALLLLPEILGGAPGELRRHAAVRIALDAVEDTAYLIETDLAHAIPEPLRHLEAALGTLIVAGRVLRLALVTQSLGACLEVVGAARRFQAILRSWPTTARFCCQRYDRSGVQSA